MKKFTLIATAMLFPALLFAQDAPEAEFSCDTIESNDSTCCFSFTDLSKNTPHTWTWTFEGGIPTVSSEQNPGAICYQVNGIYNVVLIVENDYGTDSIHMQDYIHVSDDTCACLDETDIEHLQLSDHEMYPNPATDQAVINFQRRIEHASLKIYNIQGNLVRREENLAGKSFTLHRNELQSGLYFIVISDKKSVILKEKLLFTNH